MGYRSVAFVTYHTCKAPMIETAARLGFNDVCFHTEHGDQAEDIRKVHEHLAASGLLELIEGKGMTISLWVHEFMDIPEAWGEPAVDNETLWQKLDARYDHYLEELFPEVDYLVLTTSETQRSPRGADLYHKLLQFLAEKCNRHDKKLVVRNFGHSPGNVRSWPEKLAGVPPGVTVQTKCVPQDWNMRSIHHPLIGRQGAHREFVEFDVGGEYFRRDKLANCFSGILADRMNHAFEKGVEGISVRVERHGPHCFGHPNEVNLWLLGLRSSGRVTDEDAVWRRYAAETFGEQAAPAMTRALRPTGQVNAEAFSVGRETFGNCRGSRPTGWRPKGKPFQNLLFWPWSPWRYAVLTDPDSPLKQEYLNSLRGEPSAIEREQKGYAFQRESAKQSLRELTSVKDRLDPSAYKLCHWLLEENLFHLSLMEEAQLAWLKAKRIEHIEDRADYQFARERDRLREEIRGHLENLKDMQPRMGERMQVTWQGYERRFRRGSYFDLDWFLEEFPAWVDKQVGWNE